ncbi:MAG: replication initiator protein [Microvirus sp.]|nr:MAG: replication initiator protein [Microvirus sp.]
MTCYKPLPAFKCSDGSIVFHEKQRFDIVGDIKVPCGQCIGCRLDRASNWTTRIMHEVASHEKNCWLTLTYDEDHLPPGGSLHYPHFQTFMRSLRRAIRPIRPRFYMCGEYGSNFERPHYHACIFGYAFTDQALYKSTDTNKFIYQSPLLTKLWPHGQATIGELTRQSASYTARYCLKKITGDLALTHYAIADADGTLTLRTPEFSRMSLKPGIGAAHFTKYLSDFVTFDYSITPEGKRTPLPPYYDKLHKRLNPNNADQTKEDRVLKALTHAANNTPDRLQVRETVTNARIKSLKRTLS